MATKRKGQGTKIRIDLNGVGASGANWTILPLRRKATISRITSTEDASTADDNGWESVDVNGGGWEISVDFLLDPADPVYTYLIGIWEALGDSSLYVSVDSSAIGGTKREARAIITKFEEDHSNRALVTGSVTFKMLGAPVVCAS